MFKRNDLMGIFTKEGAITISMPKEYFYETEKNPCYKTGCE